MCAATLRPWKESPSTAWNRLVFPELTAWTDGWHHLRSTRGSIPRGMPTSQLNPYPGTAPKVTMLIKSFLVPSAALFIAGCALAGCGNSDRQAATSRTTAEVTVTANTAKQELRNVVTTLKNLSIAEDSVRIKALQADLKSQTGDLRSELEELDASATAAIAAGNSQLTAWHSNAAGIGDTEMRKGSTQREGVLRKAVDDLQASHSRFVTTHVGYMKQLDEMIKTLDLDQTKQGVKSVKSAVSRLTDDDGESLVQSIDQVTEKSKAVSAATHS